jgi:hypothetical protein
MTDNAQGRRGGNGRPERRKQPRWKVFELAQIHTGSGEISCVIDDLSLTGALISAEVSPSPGEDVSFVIEETFTIAATAVHNQGSLTGLRFNMDPEQTAAFARWLNEIDKDGET